MILSKISRREPIRLKTEKFLGSDAKSHFSLGHPLTPRGRGLAHLAPRCNLSPKLYHLLFTRFITVFLMDNRVLETHWNWNQLGELEIIAIRNIALIVSEQLINLYVPDLVSI